VLLDAELFGRAAAAAARDPALSLDAIPPSSLNLTLTGVMVTAGGSFALISAGGGPELPFAVGHEVAPGASLYAVYPDRVLIRRGGATESLMLKDSDTAPAGAPAGARSARAPSGANRVIQARSGDRFTVDREQLTRQMQTPEFLTQALMVPNPGGGFLVREIQPGSLYEKLGLRVGDVITTVNGQPVNTVEDVMRLYSQFGSTSSVQVEIQRSGNSETLVYNLQ
jgi:general secretion pathway protein C